MMPAVMFAERQIREINAGIYAFDGEFLRDALMHVGTNNNQGEVYLTDVLAQAYQADRVTNGVVLDDQWMAQGCNDRVQLAELAAEMNICVQAFPLWIPQAHGSNVMSALMRIQRSIPILFCAVVPRSPRAVKLAREQR